MGAGVSGAPPPASSPPPPKGSGVLVGEAADPAGAPAVGDVAALVASIVTPSRTTVGTGVMVASPAEAFGAVWLPAAVAVAESDSLVAPAAGLGVAVAVAAAGAAAVLSSDWLPVVSPAAAVSPVAAVAAAASVGSAARAVAVTATLSSD
jgi:hypothetical protein